MIKFKQIAVAVALAGTFAAAHAAPVSITTPNGVVSGITAFDWAPSPVLAQGGNQAFVNYLNNPGGGTVEGLNGQLGYGFNVFSQGRLAVLQGGTGATAALYNGSGSTANKYEITFELAYQEVVVAANNTLVPNTNIAVFDFAKVQTNNYFRVYVKDLDSTAAANYAAGTGFNTGTLVFDGTIAPGSAGSVSNFNANTGALAPIGSDGQPANGTSPLSGTPSVTGSGATPEFDLLTVLPNVINTDFWNSELISFLVTNISQNLPFQSVDPSAIIVGQVPNIGAVNGGTVCGPTGCAAAGPDILFQTDFNGPVQGIPEPGTLALAGLALGGLALARRRKA
ncbi:MAG: PEP-CTERM sorting domain-containing protein [Methyloversatilis sp.]|uniref:PEP-CTERM sorting domain-containing protein n=1 Tax=Methyloversatilis sp. TaxID=2569862 RepID=UPI0025D7374D|nr:PEP-CTERM sorting domain-containing protein [Methyloversatilis sp.]MCR6667830.1 PEP-CTERM sorting domain-containing protein [Methyloversatilis sp.]